MKEVILLLLVFCVSVGAYAQEVYKIYEGPVSGSEKWIDSEVSVSAPWSGNPLIYNVSEPSITIYRPDKAIDTGVAMIIAPGGGNRFLTWKEEGTNVAEWFQRHGVTGILLKYRTIQAGSLDEIKESLKAIWPPTQNEDPVSAQNEDSEPRNTIAPSHTETEPTLQGNDGRQAIKYVRQHAVKLGVNPNKIGIVGFSAGALLASNVIFIHDEMSRPNLAAFIYGGGVTSKIPDPMPLFICSPVNDIFPADDLFCTYQNWKATGIPAELHLIYDARHGDGLQYNGKEWNEWIDNLYKFMKAIEFVE